MTSQEEVKQITLTFDEDDISYLTLLLKIETSRNNRELSELRKEYKEEYKKEYPKVKYSGDGYFDDEIPQVEQDMEISNHILKDIILPATKELGDPQVIQQLIKARW
jgi:predicted nucleic acid-binding protein